MKYTILINQLVLSDTNLDIVDGGILNYLDYYLSSSNPKIESQRILDNEGDWTWVDLSTLLKDMPLLKIKDKSALSRRLEKIKTAGYIECKRDLEHRRMYARKTIKFDELLIQNNSAVVIEQQPQASAVVTEQQGRCFKTTNYSTNDKNTIDKVKTALPPSDGKDTKTTPPKVKPYSQMDWLTKLTQDDITYFQEKFANLPESLIKKEADKAYWWLRDKQVVKKDYRGFLRNWLEKTSQNWGNKNEEKGRIVWG